ncbi:MAG TPA: carbohydrate binding family 9 domain-containing protein [Candidatus Latescibacteria bacterium]|nr:carbohydrate binding family 9 domain-containing protein [Candidatus Latescibacterota bacterium]
MRISRACAVYIPASILFFAASPEAESIPRDANGAPVIPAVFASAPPHLDGILDDPVWTESVRLDDFYVVDYDRPPSEPTTVFLACDSANLYVAARMGDRFPGQIRMAETKRDGQYTNDDHFAIHFDVQHLHNTSYLFIVTPRGTQATTIPDGSPSKVEWQGDWVAAARVDSAGWSVEMVIPMVIFGRPAGQHTIGVAAHRWLPRLQEEMTWPNMGRVRDDTKTGNWEGIVWPAERRRPALMPYIVAERVGGDLSTYAGADMKYTTGSGLTILTTAYPDYRNIESGVLGLDFSYNEQARADNRPFVTEGAAYYPESWIFYSQRIGEMYGGGKLFGQLGRSRVGLLTAYDRNRVVHTAGKWTWQKSDAWNFDQHMVWRHGPADAPHPAGTPMASDHLMYVSIARFTRQVGDREEHYSTQGGFTKTASDTANGYDFEFHWNRHNGNGTFGYALGGRILSSGFIPVEGLLNPADAGQRDITASLEWEKRRERRWFTEVGYWAQLKYSERLNGDLYHKDATLEGWADVTPDVAVALNGKAVDRPPYVDKTLYVWMGWNRRSFGHEGGIEATAGKVKGTDYRFVSAYQNTRIGGQTSLSLSAQGVRHVYPVGHRDRPLGGTDDRYQVIGTAQFDITPEHAVSGRLIESTQGLNGYATYQQVLRRGYDLFIIIGDPSADTWTRRVALKAVVVL